MIGPGKFSGNLLSFSTLLKNWARASVSALVSALSSGMVQESFPFALLSERCMITLRTLSPVMGASAEASFLCLKSLSDFHLFCQTSLVKLILSSMDACTGSTSSLVLP